MIEMLNALSSSSPVDEGFTVMVTTKTMDSKKKKKHKKLQLLSDVLFNTYLDMEVRLKFVKRYTI